MRTSRDYLEEALAKMGDISDMKKAERLKVGRSSLSQYRSGDRVMDDFACILVAQELGIDPLAVIYAANYDREKNVERKSAWEDFRKKLGVMGVAGLLVMGMAGTPPKAEAKTTIYSGLGSNQIYIMLNRLRKFRRLAALLAKLHAVPFMRHG